MPDREKVIKEFELFIRGFHPACTSEGVELDMFREVLAMIKEQEHKDRMFHALEEDWKRLKALLKEQEAVELCDRCGRRRLKSEREGRRSGMAEARLMHLVDILNTPPETAVFIETKQTLRPAFLMGVIDRAALGIDDPFRYAINLITPAKIAKHWEWRLNNRTWRVWSARPTREQMMEVKWDG